MSGPAVSTDATVNGVFDSTRTARPVLRAAIAGPRLAVLVKS
jgi:hypothetical protein